MVNIFFSAHNKLMTEELLITKINSFPEPIKCAIQEYKSIQDQLASGIGKLLLNEYLVEIKYNNPSLHNLTFNEYGKPIISGIYFSISHTENITLLAASISNECGIDIEKIKVVEIILYKDYFTAEEWTAINCSAELYKTFYQLWTRKEAIIKLIGTGISEALKDIDVLNDIVYYNNNTFYLYSIEIAPDYCCSLATSIKEKEIIISRKEF